MSTSDATVLRSQRRRFWHVAGAAAAFQAGSAAVDSATVTSALVYQLTGSSVAVGAVPTILRLGGFCPSSSLATLPDAVCLQCRSISSARSDGRRPSLSSQLFFGLARPRVEPMPHSV